jgi:hypothetical protein
MLTETGKLRTMQNLMHLAIERHLKMRRLRLTDFETLMQRRWLKLKVTGMRREIGRLTMMNWLRHW